MSSYFHAHCNKAIVMEIQFSKITALFVFKILIEIFLWQNQYNIVINLQLNF